MYFPARTHLVCLRYCLTDMRDVSNLYTVY